MAQKSLKRRWTAEETPLPAALKLQRRLADIKTKIGELRGAEGARPPRRAGWLGYLIAGSIGAGILIWIARLLWRPAHT
jgi:hypothetical protein